MNGWRSFLVVVATLLLAPLALLWLLVRPGWRSGLLERLRPPPRRHDRPVWIHVASVGEAAAARALIEALAAEHGAVWLTAQTPSGRARLEADHPSWPCRLVPLDHPWWTTAAMSRVAPRALVLGETELWPALIGSASRLGVPVAVVSGRLSARSFDVRRELAPLLLAPFSQLARVGARTEADANRFRALGVPEPRICVTGDLKWAKPPPRVPAAPELARWLSARPTVVLGSTHPDEEVELLRALERVRASGRDVRWVFAPRHPGDVPALMRRLEDADVRAIRRSELEEDGRSEAAGLDRDLAREGDAPGRARTREQGEDASVLVLDSLGELAAVWPHGLLAVVGGTFGATGGHDLLEPVHAGRPVIFGPSTSGVAEVAHALVGGGAAIQVADGEALGSEIVRLLDDSRERAERVGRGTALLEAGRSALAANVALVAEVVAGRAPPGVSPDSPALRSIQAPRGVYARSGPAGGSRPRAAGLAAASFLYAWLTRLDRRTGRLGLRPRKRLACGVVSVGSFVAGGAAKTPITIALARALHARGHRVVVVTRGQGVRLGRRVEIASHGRGPCAPADRVGDEAAEIARAAPGVPVLASPDRDRAGLVAIAEFDCELLLLDDAFSHHALHRDVDLVCLDAAIGLGNGRVLPAGPLREPTSAWARADALLVTGGDLSRDDARRIEAHAPGLRRFHGTRRCHGWRRLRSGETSPPDALSGHRVGLLAGLADPSSFRALAESEGVEVVQVHLGPDHAGWRADDIARLGRRAPVWITTEKDAVKIDPAWLSSGVELWVLELVWEPSAVEDLVAFVEQRGLRRQRSGAPGSGSASAEELAEGASPERASAASARAASR